MVVPDRHAAALRELSTHEATQLWQLTVAAVAIVEDQFGAGGVNVGMNLGRASGAGIADHLHQHVVPRWSGDTNFMSTTGASTRVLPQALLDVYDRLLPAFRQRFALER